jgi:hypothetical protein
VLLTLVITLAPCSAILLCLLNITRRQRFYDGDELYKHMEGRHEHCFICRRRDPNKFVYYKDYAELEGAAAQHDWFSSFDVIMFDA